MKMFKKQHSCFFIYIKLSGDNMDIEQLKREMKKKRHKEVSSKSHIMTKFLITIILTLSCLITLNGNSKLQSKFYHYVYEDNFKFVKVRKLYEKYFGNVIPDKFKKTEMVFNEKLKYEHVDSYLDGCKLKVGNNYLVPALESGMVVYIGNKDKLGSTVIIEQVDGVDVWYSNVDSTSLKLYDYIEKGNLIGEAKDNTLYLTFKKDGKILKYEDYL